MNILNSAQSKFRIMHGNNMIDSCFFLGCNSKWQMSWLICTQSIRWIRWLSLGTSSYTQTFYLFHDFFFGQRGVAKKKNFHYVNVVYAIIFLTAAWLSSNHYFTYWNDFLFSSSSFFFFGQHIHSYNLLIWTRLVLRCGFGKIMGFWVHSSLL